MKWQAGLQMRTTFPKNAAVSKALNKPEVISLRVGLFRQIVKPRSEHVEWSRPAKAGTRFERAQSDGSAYIKATRVSRVGLDHAFLPGSFDS